MDRSNPDLVRAARQASTGAYAPYSHFHVGSALLLVDGSVVTGANLENASYGLSICAEAVALASAHAAGRFADVVEIAVAGPGEKPVYPCGRCRQLLAEVAAVAGHDIIVHCASHDGGEVHRLPLSQLLPHAFGLDVPS